MKKIFILVNKKNHSSGHGDGFYENISLYTAGEINDKHKIPVFTSREDAELFKQILNDNGHICCSEIEEFIIWEK